MSRYRAPCPVNGLVIWGQNMGAAATQRGNAAIIHGLESEQRYAEFEMMDMLNALPKHHNVKKPFAPIKFASDGKYWWALDQKKGWKGFGFPYPTLRDAVRGWNVVIVGYKDEEWIAETI
jgi:hypothetical protein